jgi:hypothetical protein
MKNHGWLPIALLALIHASTAAADKPDATAVSLSELAAQADLVAVVQVRDTDYIYTRSFPSEGSAYLKVLISYKMNLPGQDLIEVYDKGLHPNECYFEDPAHPDDGRRFLVFLRIDPGDPETYRGLKHGCALEILVREDAGYALRFPIDGITIADDLDSLAAPMTFRDEHALVGEESLLPTRRDELLSKGLLEPYQDQFKLTHGVDLTAARQLISAEALKEKPGWQR